MHGTISHFDTSAAAGGVLTIDCRALADNYRRLRAQVAPARAAAVVKANAYGLGALDAVPELIAAGCRDFFVAHLGEALELLPAVRDKYGARGLAPLRLYVLNGLMPGSEGTCAAAGIVPVINSLDQLERWARTAAARGEKLPAVLQFDSGMSRLGMAQEEAGVVVREGLAEGLDILAIMSHLASADEPHNPQNDDQLRVLRTIAAAFPDALVSFANSSGAFLGADYHGALARPGIALYGGAPTAAGKNPMRPVVRLDVRVIQTRTVPAGARIGYGGAFVAPATMRLATLAVGYADGLPRCLGNRGAAWFEGVRLPMVGRVSMDSLIVDATALPEGALAEGALVELIGPHQSLEDLAAAAGTISYELLTQLGRRYHRRYR
ncbi:alanine racemase [Xanthobacter sp. 91]|uniref:alanine racemase n=1 Tax=Xanthobacter sp. 91 TaxID=1117244 RepID=UPI0004970469|nr:alanine racemase [Xanthobacter sp. 91]